MRKWIVLGVVLCSGMALAQEGQHEFWDTENKVLFAGVVAARVADVHSTWRFRKLGYSELELPQRLVDNKPAFIGFSAGMVGASVWGSWMLHKHGHHRWERLVSAIHIGATGSTAGHNYTLR